METFKIGSKIYFFFGALLALKFTTIPHSIHFQCSSVISSQATQLQEAIGVMQEAIRMGDDDMNKYVEQLMQLKTENQGLRELLGIAQSMNSILMEREKKETSTQTDEAAAVKS